MLNNNHFDFKPTTHVHFNIVFQFGKQNEITCLSSTDGPCFVAPTKNSFPDRQTEISPDQKYFLKSKQFLKSFPDRPEISLNRKCSF